MKKIITPLVIVVIALVAIFIFMQQFRVEKASIGETLNLKNDVTLTVDNIEYGKNIFKDKAIQLSDKTAIVVSFTINNGGKDDFSINHDDLCVYYDGDADFRPDELYRKTNSDWDESGEFIVGKVTNKPTEFKAYILVPDDVIENTEKDLHLTMATYQFELR